MIRKHLHKIFVPGKHNSYRPHAFRHHLLTLYSIGLLISQFAFGITTFSPIATNPELVKSDIVSQINQKRAENSLTSLQENMQLNKAASEKLRDMFAKNYWDHTAPDGTKAWVFVEANGYSYQTAGENLARGFTNAKGMVSAWMNSPSHKENILRSDYMDTGVAVGNGIIDGKMITVAVQLFGNPVLSDVPQQSLIAGSMSTVSQLSLSAPLETRRLPFFVLYIALFMLVVFDGIMLKVNGLHKKKKHLYAFRAALAMNVLVLAVLTLNFASVF